MPNLSRVGDTNQAGGRIVRGASTVFANGIKVWLHESPISPHPKGNQHNAAKTTQGSPTVFCEGVPVLRVGSGNSCGHSITKGSPDIFVP